MAQPSQQQAGARGNADAPTTTTTQASTVAPSTTTPTTAATTEVTTTATAATTTSAVAPETLSDEAMARVLEQVSTHQGTSFAAPPRAALFDPQLGGIADRELYPVPYRDISRFANPRSLTADEIHEWFVRYRKARGKTMNVVATALQQSWNAFARIWNKGEIESTVVRWETAQREHSLGRLREELHRLCEARRITCHVDVEEGCRACAQAGATRATWMEWDADYRRHQNEEDLRRALGLYGRALSQARAAGTVPQAGPRTAGRDQGSQARASARAPTYPDHQGSQASGRDRSEPWGSHSSSSYRHDAYAPWPQDRGDHRGQQYGRPPTEDHRWHQSAAAGHHEQSAQWGHHAAPESTHPPHDRWDQRYAGLDWNEPRRLDPPREQSHGYQQDHRAQNSDLERRVDRLQNFLVPDLQQKADDAVDQIATLETEQESHGIRVYQLEQDARAQRQSHEAFREEFRGWRREFDPAELRDLLHEQARQNAELRQRLQQLEDRLERAESQAEKRMSTEAPGQPDPKRQRKNASPDASTGDGGDGNPRRGGRQRDPKK